MKNNTTKLIITGALLLPLLLLAAYTFRGEQAKKKGSALIPVAEGLKLSMPTEASDDIAQYIKDDDFETATLKIEQNIKDPNIPTTDGFPLVAIAADKNSNELVNMLIARGADVNFAEVDSGETALMKAARNGNADMVAVLLSANANVNATSKRGLTPLTAALNKKDSLMANSLISRGARAGVSKENLLNYAFQRHSLGVDIMLKGGADTDYADANGNTALIVMSAAGDGPSVRALVDYRADINAANKFGMTPLLYAVKNKHKDVAVYLMGNSRTEINKANAAKENALYWAAYLGQDELAQNLLMLNADYKAVTKQGISAQQIATKNGHPKTAKVIADYIAYKSIPRDNKGRPIVPKKQVAGKAAATKKDSTNQKSAQKNQPAADPTASALDMNAIMGGMGVPNPEQATAIANMTPDQQKAMAAAQQQQAMTAAQQGGVQQQAPKASFNAKNTTSPAGQQKTVINKLRTSSL